MKHAWVTCDLEEWYELRPLRPYRCDRNGVRVIPQIIDLLDMLDAENVKATFFCEAQTAYANADILREIVRRGHEIGCHGYDSELLTGKTADQFRRETIEAKQIVEKAARHPVRGFRARYASLDRRKLEIVRDLGFSYDSSRIPIEKHPVYRELDLFDFEQTDDLVYMWEDFTEYEIPVLDVCGKMMPLSGSLLGRIPFLLAKRLLKRYAKRHENFLLYVQPYAVTDTKLPLPRELGIADRIRIGAGRRHALKRLKRVIRLLKQRGARFTTLEADQEERRQV